VPYIASLRLIDFRSYAALDAEFETGVIVFYGPNGAGKTNLLEAISLLAPGRGLRRAKVNLLARVDDGAPSLAWGINANLTTEDSADDARISIGQVPEHPGRRQLNAQDRLFTGPASDRRKFIDRFALAYSSDHGSNAIRFEKARTERNRLLSESITDRAWYEAIETDLSKYGALIAQARVATISNLQAEITARETAFPKSLIGLDGALENKFTEGGWPDFNGSAPDGITCDAYGKSHARWRVLHGRTKGFAHRVGFGPGEGTQVETAYFALG